MSNIKDYILVIENAVTPALCEAVLSEYANTDEWTLATTAAGKTDAERQCSIIGISWENVLKRNLQTRSGLDKYLFTAAANVISKYNQKFPLCKIEQDSGYDLLKYEPGKFYTEHVDSFKQRPRAISCSFALNDDYEGGEFAFFNRELVYNLKKGDALMFPSNFMYPHEIMPVTSGTRYSIVTWFI